jgi:GAF domain-containing protein/CHASE3 domain sensor protein
MTIAKRLTLLLAVPLLVLTVLGLFVVYQLNHIELKSKFVGVQIESLAVIGNISQCLTEMRVSTRTYFLAEDKDEQSRAEKAVLQNAVELENLLARYGDSLVTGDKDRRLFADVLDLSRQWSVEAHKLMVFSTSDKRSDGMTLLLAGTFPQLGARLANALNAWITHNEELAKDAGRATQSAITDSERKLLSAVAIAMLLSGVLGLLTFRRIVHPMQALQASVECIAAGDYDQTVPFTNATDETGSLARSIAVLKQGAATTAEQGWVKANVARLATAFQSAESLRDFGQTLLSRLVPTVGGGAAAFYFFQADSGRLHRVATYGFSEDTRTTDSMPLGEGLVGECARQRTSIRLTDLPPGYLRVSSALGEAPPAHTVAFPLVTQDHVLGAIELASFRPFNAREEALLAELLPMVTMSLEVLSHNMAREELLARTQEQAQQLEEQATAISERSRLDAMNSEIGSALVRSQSFSSMMQSCAEAVLKGVHGAFTRIWMIEPGTNTLALCTSVGQYTHLNGEHARVKVGEHKLGRIAEARRPLETNVLQAEPGIDIQWAREQGLVSFAGYPLVVQDFCPTAILCRGVQSPF